MANTDLPSWAPVEEQPPAGDQSAAATAPGGPPGGRLLVVLLGLLLVGVIGLGAYLLLGDEEEEDTLASGTRTGSGSEVSPDAAVVDTEAAGDTSPPTDAAVGDTSRPTDEAAGAEPAEGPDENAAAPAEPVPDNHDGSIRHTRLADGLVYLEGSVPTQEMKDLFYESTARTAAPERIVNNLVVDPASPAEVDGYPIFIDDVILFDSGSAEVRDESRLVLERLGAWITVASEIEMTIIARTDARGSTEANLALARDRAVAVQDLMVGVGADPAQLPILALGEADMPEGQTDEEAEASRRVEFQLARRD